MPHGLASVVTSASSVSIPKLTRSLESGAVETPSGFSLAPMKAFEQPSTLGILRGDVGVLVAWHRRHGESVIASSNLGSLAHAGQATSHGNSSKRSILDINPIDAQTLIIPWWESISVPLWLKSISAMNAVASCRRTVPGQPARPQPWKSKAA